MNKKIFQSLFMIGAMLVGTAGFVGCSEDYDDDIDRLEMLIDENENAISAINQLVASGSVITGVATNAEGLEITLSNGQKYTITNGVDGMNGQDAVLWTVGQDGYWYKDGVKQDFKAVGQDGVDGQDGADGVNGEDGAPGGYYKPNADGTWDLYAADGTLVNADTGLDWKVPLGGDEEPLTAVWNADGSLVLSGEATGNQTVIIGQSVLTDLVFIPEMTLDGHNAQEVRWLPLRDSGKCNGRTGMVAAEEVHYRINPITIDPDDVDWAFVGRDLETRAAIGDMDYYEPITSHMPYGVGALTFLLQPGEEDSEWFDMSSYDIPNGLRDGQMVKTFALKGVQDVQSGQQETQTIVSDYAVVLPVMCEPVIARTDMEVPNPHGANPNLLTTDNVYDNIPHIDDPETYEIHPGHEFDLSKYVFACVGDDMQTREDRELCCDLNFVENEGFLTEDYRIEFTKVTNYLGNDGQTDQSYFIDIDPVTSILTVNTNSSSLARRPVVKVTWYSNKDYGCPMANPIVKVAYIKFLITPEPVAIDPFELGAIPYRHLFVENLTSWTNDYRAAYPNSSHSYYWMCVDWETVNDHVYEPLGTSHDEFMETYYRELTGPWPWQLANYTTISHKMMDGSGNYTITPTHSPVFAWWFPNLFITPNVDTYVMCLGITPFAKFGKYEMKVKVDPGDHHPVITFTFHYEVLEPDLVVPMVPGFLLDPNADPKTIVTQGTDYGPPGNYMMQAYAGEAFNRGMSINGATSYRSFFGQDGMGEPMWVPGKINETDHRILLREGIHSSKRLTMLDYWSAQGHYWNANTGPAMRRSINQILGYNDQEGILYRIHPNWKLWEDQREYKMKLKTMYPNGCMHEHPYNLRFVNPLEMMVAPILYTDHINGNKDFQDLRDNVTASINGAYMLMSNDNNSGSNPYNYYSFQPFFDYGLAPSTILWYSYQSTNSPYQDFLNPQFNSLGMYDGRYTWENDGTKLITTEKIGEMTITLETPFAKRVHTVDVNVEPGVTPPDTPTVPQ